MEICWSEFQKVLMEPSSWYFVIRVRKSWWNYLFRAWWLQLITFNSFLFRVKWMTSFRDLLISSLAFGNLCYYFHFHMFLYLDSSSWVLGSDYRTHTGAAPPSTTPTCTTEPPLCLCFQHQINIVSSTLHSPLRLLNALPPQIKHFYSL